MNVSKIIQDLEKIEGLSNIKLLKKEDKQNIIGLEDKNNIGVIECIKRNHTLVLTHDERFREPISKTVMNKNKKIIFPSIEFPEVRAKNVVSSSPSEKVHNLLVKKYNIKIINNDATLLIGFD